MIAETTQRPAATLSRARDAGHSPGRSRTKLIGVKGTPELHERLRRACAEDGASMAAVLGGLLDLRERHRREAAHPLVG